MEQMVAWLVTEDTQSLEEEIVSSSKGLGVSLRVSMEMEILRLTTSQMVLGTTQTLFLLEDYPLLWMVDWLIATFGVQGWVTASSSDPSLYQLELQVPMRTADGDTLVSSLMSDRANSLILKGARQMSLLDNQ